MSYNVIYLFHIGNMQLHFEFTTDELVIVFIELKHYSGNWSLVTSNSILNGIALQI